MLNTSGFKKNNDGYSQNSYSRNNYNDEKDSYRDSYRESNRDNYRDVNKEGGKDERRDHNENRSERSENQSIERDNRDSRNNRHNDRDDRKNKYDENEGDDKRNREESEKMDRNIFKGNISGNTGFQNGSSMINLIRNKSDTSDKYKSSFLNSNKFKNITLETVQNNNIQSNIQPTQNKNIFQQGGNLLNTVDKDRIEWNEDQNQYILYENNIPDCVFSHDDIIYYVLNPETGKNCIKKYIVIISNNPVIGVYEFNFINSIFTNNLEYMVKLQNYIYNLINSFNNVEKVEDETYQEILILFYYQMIIWMYKNMSTYEGKNDNNKIAKLYSCFSFRFSSLVLKNVLTIQNSCFENSSLLDKLSKIKDDIYSQLIFINEYILEQENYLSDNNSATSKSDTISYNKKYNLKSGSSTGGSTSDSQASSEESDSCESEKSNASSKSIDSTDSTATNSSKNSDSVASRIKLSSTEESGSSKSSLTSNNESINTGINSSSVLYKSRRSRTTTDNSDSNNYIVSKNMKNGKGLPISNINELFTEQAELDSNDSENAYKEIEFGDTLNDTVTSYKIKKKKFPLVPDIETSQIKSTTATGTTATGTTATRTGTTSSVGGSTSRTGASYNINSAVENSKVYKLKI